MSDLSPLCAPMRTSPASFEGVASVACSLALRQTEQAWPPVRRPALSAMRRALGITDAEHPCGCSFWQQHGNPLSLNLTHRDVFTVGSLPQAGAVMIPKYFACVFAAVALAGCCASGTGCYAPLPGSPVAWDSLGPGPTDTAQATDFRPRKISRPEKEIVVGPIGEGLPRRTLRHIRKNGGHNGRPRIVPPRAR
jgi:hypothetical protein